MKSREQLVAEVVVLMWRADPEKAAPQIVALIGEECAEVCDHDDYAIFLAEEIRLLTQPPASPGKEPL